MPGAVIMGVAGSGKSTVGARLARSLGAVYIDGDDLHPETNVAKMSAGQPLTDDDRAPWLMEVGRQLGQADGPLLIGCSALKRRYREAIRDNANTPVVFVHLSGDRAVIERRMALREGHFMPLSLIESQFAALEPLEPDETGFAVPIDQSLDAIVAQIAKHLTGGPAWHETSR